MRRLRWRVAMLAASMALFLSLAGGPAPAWGQTDTGEDGSELWNEPFNVSKSGSASLPALAVEPDGTLYALWWDQFDGTRVSYYTLDDGWSESKAVTQILGGRTLSGGKAVRIPPNQLRLIASKAGWVHAFWLDTNNNLRYARSRSQTGVFALGPTLAANPLAWDVSLDDADVVHLAFIRSDNTAAMPSGVYYRASPSDGATWRAPEELITSLYFRPLPGNAAFVRVASDGAGAVLVDWDDPELRRSFYTLSTDGGETFEEPAQVEAIEQSFARRTRFVPIGVPDGELLRLWEAADSCALYQQSSPDRAATWSDPVRVLETLGGCVGREAHYPLADSRLLGMFQMSDLRTFLATWDGSRWTEPLNLQISFVESSLNRPITLGCLSPVLAGETMAVAGCDPFGDVWVTTSKLALPDLLPALTTAWSAPRILSSGDGDAGLPAATIDSDGRLYAMWSRSLAPDQPGRALDHTHSDGVNWPDAVDVVTASEGKADQPALAAGPGSVLHMVWSGGFAGEILYSHAFVRDSRGPDGWSAPVQLPAPREVGGWPDLVASADGALHAVYVVPLNEDRGVYYTRSDDDGQTWGEEHKVFDAAKAGWAMVRSSRIAVDASGRLHVVWARAALPGAGTTLGIYYSRSLDGGQTWSEPLVIDGEGAESPRLIVSAPNEIHLIWSRPIGADWQLLQQWTPDGGESWSRPEQVLGLRRITSPEVGVAADGRGSVYVAGIQRSSLGAAALFFAHWDGQDWIDRETVALGYNPSEGSGAAAVLLPEGTLGVLYRVHAPLAGGSSQFVVGYISRPVSVGPALPAPTFTPQPTPNQAVVQALASSTPYPTPDLSNVTPPTVNDTVRLQIGVVLVVIVLVSALALFRLVRGRR